MKKTVFSFFFFFPPSIFRKENDQRKQGREKLKHEFDRKTIGYINVFLNYSRSFYVLVSTTIDYENTTQNGNVSIHILILTYRTDRKDCYCIVEILRTVDLFQIDFLTNGTEFFLETIVFPFLMKPIEVIFEEEQIQIIIQIIRSYYSFIFILLCQIYIRVRF